MSVVKTRARQERVFSVNQKLSLTMGAKGWNEKCSEKPGAPMVSS